MPHQWRPPGHSGQPTAVLTAKGHGGSHPTYGHYGPSVCVFTDHDGHSYQVITRYGELRRSNVSDGAVVVTGACRYCQVSPTSSAPAVIVRSLHVIGACAIVRSLYVIGACRVRYVIGVLPWHHIQTGLTKETLIFHSKWGPFLMPIMHFQSSLFVGSQNTLTITSYQNQLLLHHIDINRPNLSSVNCFGQSGQVFDWYTEGPQCQSSNPFGLTFPSKGCPSYGHLVTVLHSA